MLTQWWTRWILQKLKVSDLVFRHFKLFLIYLTIFILFKYNCSYIFQRVSIQSLAFCLAICCLLDFALSQITWTPDTVYDSVLIISFDPCYPHHYSLPEFCIGNQPPTGTIHGSFPILNCFSFNFSYENKKGLTKIDITNLDNKPQ